jgi:hypothetical protein
VIWLSRVTEEDCPTHNLPEETKRSNKIPKFSTFSEIELENYKKI